MTVLNRRSFVAQVLGATAGVAGATWASRSQAQVSDSDGGATADPSGGGRGPARNEPTGVSDADSGPAADRANYGRGGLSNTPAPAMTSSSETGSARAPETPRERQRPLACDNPTSAAVLPPEMCARF